jgi:AcrR family transcriptional regulator
MARPRRVSDEDILTAVRSAVLEQGPHVSLDVVAGRLGVTAPALFRRFGSRQGLLLAALRGEEMPPFIADLEGGPDERPVESQLIAVFESIGSHLLTTLPCLSALRESGMPLESVHQSFTEAPPLRAVRALAGWLERARKANLLHVDDVESAAYAMMGAIQAPIFVRHLSKCSGAWDVAGYTRRVVRLFLSGMSRQPVAKAASAPVRRASNRRLAKRS